MNPHMNPFMIFLLITMMMFDGLAFACAPTEHRSTTERRHFQKAFPCPSTGLTAGSCPGYIIDHIQPLCAGGQDVAANMQWQTLADASSKDKVECKKKPVKVK